MGERENHMIVGAAQQPGFDPVQPTFGLHRGALGTAPVFAPVAPQLRHLALGTPLHLAPIHGGAALHQRAGGLVDRGGLIDEPG